MFASRSQSIGAVACCSAFPARCPNVRPKVINGLELYGASDENRTRMTSLGSW
jgi:hypothetical protein